jgi:hypothetical protein
MMFSSAGDILLNARRILFVGAGGGYDIFGAVPWAVETLAAGREVHFAGVTFTSVSTLPGARAQADHPELYAIGPAQAVEDRYCPEAWLARWLEEAHGYREPLWLLKKSGVLPTARAYGWLARTLAVDAILLVDGGVDVLLKGNETSIGTPVEDLCSLAGLSTIDVPNRLVACVGFGAELRDGIRHAQALERMAELTRAGAQRGVVSLERRTPAGEAFRQALEFTFAGQPGQKHSHVQEVILAALRGEFGGGSDVWVSPLACLYWFFDLAEVARSHIFLSHLMETESVFDATAVIRECRKAVPARPPTDIPL